MRILIVILIAVLTTQFVTSNANACGDKTMRVKTGLRFYQTEAAKNPSKILIHSVALPSGKAVELREFLNKKAGHKSKVVDDVGSLKTEIRTSHYDLVLTNLAEAAELQKLVQSLTPNTRVVPVLFKQSKPDEKAAAKQYKVIINNPTDGLDFLIAVSRVMKSQSKKS